MTPFLAGFANELVKISSDGNAVEDAFREAKKETRAQPTRDSALSQLRGQGAPVSRDYLASMLIGAASAPAITMLGKRIARHVGNKDVLKALKGVASPKARAALKAELHIGPTFGRGMPGVPMNRRPLMTHGEALSDAAKGAVGGGALQMIRDFFAGSKQKES